LHVSLSAVKHVSIKTGDAAMPSPHFVLPEPHALALTQSLHDLVRPAASTQHQIDITDLCAIAIAHTDFIGDLDAAALVDNAANSADLAADIWTDAHDQPVPLAVIVAARLLLVEHGYLLLCEREQAEIDALADGVEAGDLDRDGAPIPYPIYKEIDQP
jgi:hypothetical protein